MDKLQIKKDKNQNMLAVASVIMLLCFFLA